jgi:hypothetical protein
MFCICVKKPLPPGDNPIAVNKYYYYKQNERRKEGLSARQGNHVQNL